MVRPKYAVSIDPGRDLGYAIWDWKKWKKCVPPIAVGVINSKREQHWTSAVQTSMGLLAEVLEEYAPFGYGGVEWPQFYDSAQGHMVARRGDLNKLTYTVGYITCMLQALGCITTELVPVATWKGQLSKVVVNKRIVKVLGAKRCTSFSSHAWDAVGIGLYAKGYFE